MKASKSRRMARKRRQALSLKSARSGPIGRAKQSKQIDRADPVRPTPETVAKLEPDPLRDLVDGGLIDAAGERAAQEIMMVYCAVCRGVMRQSRPLGPYTPGIFDMPEEIAEAHALRYLPWARQNLRQTVQATIDLVVDRINPNSGPVRHAVIQALTDYANRFERSPLRMQQRRGGEK